MKNTDSICTRHFVHTRSSLLDYSKGAYIFTHSATVIKYNNSSSLGYIIYDRTGKLPKTLVNTGRTKSLGNYRQLAVEE